MLSRLAVALVHYPVLNRRNEVVASAVTNLETFQSIQGVPDYNHLPVRAAAAIILDRIFTGR